MNQSDNTTDQIRNSKVSDSGGKLIFGNKELCAQLLRDYGDLDILKNVKAEDIEDVTERFLPMFTEERNADVVKKVHLSEGKEMFIISLIDHKSVVDYNVSMQMLRYMVYIWEDYEKQMEKEHEGICGTKGFKYPPILPIVYYEGAKEWIAEREFSNRIFLNAVFEDYIPHFCYKLIQLNDYSKEEITERGDELSIVMLINKLRKAEEFKDMEFPVGYLEKIGREAPADVLDVLARVIATLLRRIEVPEEEVGSFTDRIKERKVSGMFEDFEPYSVIETRRVSREEGRIEGEERLLIDQICKKLRKGKSIEQIAEELEVDITRITAIYNAAEEFGPEYNVDKVAEALGVGVYA